ncbi:hypothetical protein HMPREF1544_05642 [Mucor circinelloides 1006PhL]|uniref:BAG domain-containing protein n=1 Tax=Mucor circinelloides f. circinelloides (strain 1006PhL) TaxID=1220926 RepID=S2JBH1_MUCC1|nr:hypothetical protein HMPREF1544_05642 [Mucor circinelloides 1006PhL]
MFYFQHPVYQQQRRHQLSVDDYVQLQLLLRQEQAQREQAALYKKQQQEQRRLEKALYNLKVMTELQRRREQEELAIQAYYAAKKRRQQQEEALLRHRREQEEAYLNALLEQRKIEQYQLRALALEQQFQEQATKSVEYTNPCHVMTTAACPNFAEAEQEEEVSDSESEADQEHEVAEQLESLVRFIFGQQEADEQAEDVPEQEEQQEQESQEEGDADSTEQTMSMDEFVDYISKKAQELDDDAEDENDDAMEEDDLDLAASAIQHIDDHESEDEDKDEKEEEDEDEDSAMEQDEEVPALVESTESLHHLVNDILANTTNEESFSDFPEEDPVKIAKFEALSRIEQELNEIRQQHEDHVLHATLDFSHDGRSASPDIIPASTAENREFLGYEDQLVKILLKLDMIESDGDEHIRNERKALVKRAETMLDKLDEYKQKEWERVSCSSHSDNEDMEEEYVAVL